MDALGTRALYRLGGTQPQPGDLDVLGRKHRTEELLREFHEYLVAELGRSPRTAEGYVKDVRCLCRWTGSAAGKISADDLRRFKREAREDYAPATIQKVVVAMHQFHKWGALEGYWPLNGIAAVPTPSTPFVPKPPLAFDTARMLMASCQTPLEYRVVWLGLYAGLRIAESASVTEREWFGDRITVVGKGTKQRSVPVHRHLQKVRPLILQSTPKSDAVLHSSMMRIRDRTRATDVKGNPATSHGLRRTFADALYDKFDVPQEVVGALLGHGKKVTELYAPVRYERMRAAVDLLDYTAGEPVQLALFEVDAM